MTSTSTATVRYTTEGNVILQNGEEYARIVRDPALVASAAETAAAVAEALNLADAARARRRWTAEAGYCRMAFDAPGFRFADGSRPSGRLFEGTFRTRLAAQELGLVGVDRFEHVGVPGPQPTGRTRADGRPVVQQHARRNLSTLLVLRRPRKESTA